MGCISTQRTLRCRPFVSAVEGCRAIAVCQTQRHSENRSSQKNAWARNCLLYDTHKLHGTRLKSLALASQIRTDLLTKTYVISKWFEVETNMTPPSKAETLTNMTTFCFYGLIQCFIKYDHLQRIPYVSVVEPPPTNHAGLVCMKENGS